MSGKTTRENSSKSKATTPLPPQEYDALVLQFAREYGQSHLFHDGNPEKVAIGARLLALSPTEQVQVLLACSREFETVLNETDYELLLDLEERLLRRKLPFCVEDFDILAETVLSRLKFRDRYIDCLSYVHYLRAFETVGTNVEFSNKTLSILRKARELVDSTIAIRIDSIVGDTTSISPIEPGEVWSEAAHSFLDTATNKDRSAWCLLLHHCAKAKGGRPTEKWNKESKKLLPLIDIRQFERCLTQWLALLDKEDPKSARYSMSYAFSELNQAILKGLIWCGALRPSEPATKALGIGAISAFKKMPGIGPKSAQIGNACLYALAQMAVEGGVTQLSVLKTKIKQQNAKNLINKYLASSAEQLGIAADQIEERCVPDFGLTDVGLFEEKLGAFTCRLEVNESTQLGWQNAKGKIQKSIPAAIKKLFEKRIKEIKKVKKEIDKMLPVQRQRIEELYLKQLSWPLDAWRKRYLEHPLVGTIVRRLIWNCKVKKRWIACAFVNGEMVNINSEPVAFSDINEVKTWHPIQEEMNEVLRWRDWLAEHKIKQPFKQAHREVYILTPAEEQTGSYSNRFAAHILKQTRFRGIAPVRNWKTDFLGPWDGGDCGIASKKLNEWQLESQFWYNAVVDDEISNTTGFTYLSSDQVQFLGIDGESVRLVEVPKIVFSEILRDLDLFIGVCSIANDPNWFDSGERQYRDYWQEASFGDLSETAKTRKTVLEDIIPRLTIADQCSIEDRFLFVKGKLNQYKIHLGSGNVLTVPGNRYLCIVPKPASSVSTVFLPFEGDNRLSLILSLAILLADESKIKDPTVLSQLK